MRVGTDDELFVVVVIISAFNFNFIPILFQLFVAMIRLYANKKIRYYSKVIIIRTYSRPLLAIQWRDSYMYN